MPLVFLYRQVLELDLGWMEKLEPRQAQSSPAGGAHGRGSATGPGLHAGIAEAHGLAHLRHRLRVMECVSLRCWMLISERKDRGALGKGAKDRVTLLPQNLVGPLQHHLLTRAAEHSRPGCGAGASHRYPMALARKYPNAAQAFKCSMSFRPRWSSAIPRPTGPRAGTCRRRPCNGAVRDAVRDAGSRSTPRSTPSGIALRPICLQSGCDIRTIQTLWVTTVLKRP